MSKCKCRKKAILINIKRVKIVKKSLIIKIEDFYFIPKENYLFLSSKNFFHGILMKFGLCANLIYKIYCKVKILFKDKLLFY
jgi:hypothetical protein